MRPAGANIYTFSTFSSHNFHIFRPLSAFLGHILPVFRPTCVFASLSPLKQSQSTTLKPHVFVTPTLSRYWFRVSRYGEADQSKGGAFNRLNIIQPIVAFHVVTFHVTQDFVFSGGHPADDEDAATWWITKKTRYTRLSQWFCFCLFVFRQRHYSTCSHNVHVAYL